MNREDKQELFRLTRFVRDRGCYFLPSIERAKKRQKSLACVLPDNRVFWMGPGDDELRTLRKIAVILEREFPS